MNQLREAGSALGSLHQATGSYPESKHATGDSYWDSEQKRMETTWCDVLEAEGPTDLVDLLREHLAELRPYKDDLEAQPNCIIHGDFRAQNMVYEGNRLAAILDLDSARRAPRIFDLAYALAFFQAVLSPRPLGKVEMTQFSKAYSGKVELTDHEKLLMPKALEFCILQGVSLWLDVAYVSRMNRDSILAWVEAYRPLLSGLDRNGELVF
jgi:homoserine kinase type II